MSREKFARSPDRWRVRYRITCSSKATHGTYDSRERAAVELANLRQVLRHIDAIAASRVAQTVHQNRQRMAAVPYHRRSAVLATVVEQRAPGGLYRCPRCGRWKSADLTGWSLSGRTGQPIARGCRDCGRRSSAEFRAGRPRRRRTELPNLSGEERRMHHYLVRRFGITLAEYRELLEAQGGRCAICRRVPDEADPNGWRFCVDHDHETGAVRGLLCRTCNIGLGAFRDDPRLLDAATRYITGRTHAERIGAAQ